jgi:hypothetical protein
VAFLALGRSNENWQFDSSFAGNMERLAALGLELAIRPRCKFGMGNASGVGGWAPRALPVPRRGTMRATFASIVVFLSGCQTAEIAVMHPPTGIHVVARVEAKEPAAPPFVEPSLIAATAPPPARIPAVEVPAAWTALAHGHP